MYKFCYDITNDAGDDDDDCGADGWEIFKRVLHNSVVACITLNMPLATIWFFVFFYEYV